MIAVCDVSCPRAGPIKHIQIHDRRVYFPFWVSYCFILYIHIFAQTAYTLLWYQAIYNKTPQLEEIPSSSIVNNPTTNVMNEMQLVTDTMNKEYGKIISLIDPDQSTNTADQYMTSIEKYYSTLQN